MAKKRKSHRRSTRPPQQAFKKVPALFAKSPRTNIRHTFANPRLWEQEIEALAAAYQARIVQDLLSVVPFWNWLQQQPVPNPPGLVEWNSPLYRIVFGGLNPLSVEGTLAHGGRYNVGGAQELPLDALANVQMRAAIYAADSIDCARAEAGPFLNRAEIYELRPRRTLALWDIEKIFERYNWPGLRNLVESQPFYKLWKLQKTPTVSQLLGGYLRQSGDGILSYSTKFRNGRVITAFVQDGNRVQEIFTSTRVN